MEGAPLWIGLLLASCLLATASAEKNVTELVDQLKNNQTEAIAADSILGEITPLFSGYASLNQKVCPDNAALYTYHMRTSWGVPLDSWACAHGSVHESSCGIGDPTSRVTKMHLQVPIPVQFNCRNPKPLGGIASRSAAAQQYVNELKYSIGDGWSPVLNSTAKGKHNESWALGLTWNSNCIEDSENVPECEMHFDAPFRASGGAQIRRTPAAGSVTFDKCSIFFDSTFLNSTTCFQVCCVLMLPILFPGGVYAYGLAGLAATMPMPLVLLPS